MRPDPIPTHGSPKDHWLFLARNKNCRYDQSDNFAKLGEDFPLGAFYPLTGSPGRSHTFSRFVNAKDWFETRPEYFSLVDGKRLPAYTGAGPGQLCLTHPDVRRLTIEKLREFIAGDRAEAKTKGVLPPRVYSVAQNDKYRTHCQCEHCQAVVTREGSESGPLIDFVNHVAAAIEPEYPDILVATIAYNLTRSAPTTIRPRPNVLVRWCDVYTRSDHLRPLTHPCNKKQYDDITRWGEVASRVGVGDYWTLLSPYESFPLPWTMMQCLGPDIRLFADLGCRQYYAEAASYMEPGKQFKDLEYWLAFHLLVDPYQPIEPLIRTFIDGYYGRAAPAMGDYLTYLTNRIDVSAEYMRYREAPHRLGYLDVDFFVTAQRLFDEAQSRIEHGSLQEAHVMRDRLVLDTALLYLWPWLERTLPDNQALPFDHEQIVKRFEAEWAVCEKHWYNRYTRKGHFLSHNKDGMRLERLAALFRDPQLPGRFRGLPRQDVADFNAWLTFPIYQPRQHFLPDEDAVGGMTATLGARSTIQAAEEGGGAAEQAIPAVYREPVTFGVTGGATITLKSNEIPGDEKYHLYGVGSFEIRPGTMVWALKGRRMGVAVDRLYVPKPDDPVENLWNGYLSMRFAGPAYVKGSTSTNGVFIDRVLLVRPHADVARDSNLSQVLEKQKQRYAVRPTLHVPRQSARVAGDPRAVNWETAAKSKTWKTLLGNQTDRIATASLAHDGNYLYVLLQETGIETAVIKGAPFGGDHWEFLFAAQRGEPYRQIGIGPAGKVRELAYGEAAWKSEATVFSQMEDQHWSLYVAFPLDRLLPGGVAPGDTVYANILRGGGESLVWSPTYERNFNLMVGYLGELTLE